MTDGTETRVKICGLTVAEDAGACQALGADLLGVIFADGPRRITIEQAARIRAAAPGVSLVGVFADTHPELVLEAVRRTGLDLIQLHGRESPAYCRDLAARSGLPLIKALRVSGPGGEVMETGRGIPQDKPRRVEDDCHQMAGGPEATGDSFGAFAAASYFLLDLDKHATMFETVELLPALWSLAVEKGRAGHAIFLAGALTPSNVGQAVLQIDPYGVDVCRGVEQAPGRKDLAAVKRFIQEAKRARA